MNFKPAILSLILLPIVVLNIWLSAKGMEGVGFVVWLLLIAMLTWVNAAWVFVEIFKELKRRRVKWKL